MFIIFSFFLGNLELHNTFYSNIVSVFESYILHNEIFVAYFLCYILSIPLYTSIFEDLTVHFFL